MKKNKAKYAPQARIDLDLADQIEMRRKYFRRSFTSEINYLLKRAMEMIPFNGTPDMDQFRSIGEHIHSDPEYDLELNQGDGQ